MIVLILLYGLAQKCGIAKLLVKSCKHLYCKTSTPTSQAELSPSIEIQFRILTHLANLFTKPDKLFIKIYNAPLMLYTGNDYKPPWTKTTLHVHGLGFYWRIQAVDNIDIYIVKTILQCSSKIGF